MKLYKKFYKKTYFKSSNTGSDRNFLETNSSESFSNSRLVPLSKLVFLCYYFLCMIFFN